MGRRERKKTATRQALADAALDLFLKHGYDQVSVKDVAEAADVSTTTLFKHFSGKEALIFDEDSNQEAALVAAVRERTPGQSIPAALRAYMLWLREAGYQNADLATFFALVEATPELRAYSRRMWMRHRTSLTETIAEEAGVPADDPLCAALARFALDAYTLALEHTSPQQAIERAFDLIEQGWDHARTDS